MTSTDNLRSFPVTLPRPFYAGSPPVRDCCAESARLRELRSAAFMDEIDAMTNRNLGPSDETERALIRAQTIWAERAGALLEHRMRCERAAIRARWT